MINYTNRVIIALESCMGHEIAWSDRQGRAVIAEYFAALGFPGCVVLVNGTLVKLSQRPRDDGETYFDRKSNYSLNVNVICDQNKRVIYFFVGMSGSYHDLTCLRRSGLWRRLDSAHLFERMHYLLGDSGYVPLERLVCSYKRTRGDMDKKPLEVTGAFIYILKNKVGPANLNEDLDWASYFKEKICEEIRACRKQMMTTGKRKIRPTCISIVILHILRMLGVDRVPELWHLSLHESPRLQM
ncbi:hypothetical protein R1sor_010214 [Riccia sorocarpa]|uniref:DDE Tnp4 domain-containing protein n=1 Tax=Riccia sorocarpa TaxID=122646 RepID=A0ABD3HXC2_9MARC